MLESQSKAQKTWDHA